MSDRLPPRRRSGSGKHVATRIRRPVLTTVVHAGIAVAMSAAVVLVAVNPTGGDAASAGSVFAPFTTAAAAERRAELAARERTRHDLAGVATRAVAQVAEVRAKAAQANVPADRLAALDSLEQRVDTLVVQVEAPTPDRVSRDADRTASDAGAPAGDVSPAAPPPTPTADGTPAADPAPVADAATGAAPTPRATPTQPSLDVADATALAVALPAIAAADDPTAAALRDAVLALGQAVAQVDAATDAAGAAQAAAAQQAQAAAEQAAADQAAEKVSLRGYANGRIPASALCSPAFAPTALLRCDAAHALEALDAAYLTVVGAHLQVTDSYRSYAAQVQCRAQKGNLCADPGTSNHGWGVAVDFGGDAHVSGTPAHDWLLAHAQEFGWTLPAWAHDNGSKPEPWHWEYVA